MEEKVLSILEDICGTDEIKNDMDIDLFENGLLDSLGVIELIVDIEDNFNIKLEPTEVKREDISTPRKVIEYLSKRT
ncbi:MAG TPA: D-alanine--poly(phosphoribitol) ligase subunit 2 [Clostridiaceae bacterium]|jgi:D-alanine--poly(phosphoribitol) ligase subunit 2|uniref:D-alanine--poly(phosphoribitol) ligase subunit DltC n=1 Tax=Clostridium tyrobutyricum TaxID=1519 RepID=UPI000E82B344|nr:D-alanine--poly(phosphoribitol) ligase subunit DltC [Clostridium tyrobutyricum]HAZ37321.1 D-alanine--poly(phosphoribitol) ligase subunit 2 [Clostridiaceae bacterium]HBF76365.1 D-alanine--poly(phosphoribitol) ligase subunit 2 [Clostridiaceae bacterium]HBG37833.1 D-alanine--poly(phosphoribitol) ligase subunit 2 [Clostridiaceae bacterium]HBN29183.1 D-alanine--poly(phosphoribitol) ligase subunit 2 [Clostridiaceae bacterium]HBX49139.1 D-alanine--poly(phosphoribitol) ligase subunit 2 [Clostridiac